MLLLLKFICSCTCTKTIAEQQHETVTATTTTQSNLHKLLKRAHISYTTGKCEHFIWKAHSPLYISSDVGGYIWSQCALHLTSWPFQMGSHWRHISDNTWSAVTDSFTRWGISSEGTPRLKMWTHFGFDSCFMEGLFVLHTKDLIKSIINIEELMGTNGEICMIDFLSHFNMRSYCIVIVTINYHQILHENIHHIHEDIS